MVNIIIISLSIVAECQFIGRYDLKELIYAGDGWAAGLAEDPETMMYPFRQNRQREMSVVQVKGHPYEDLPGKRVFIYLYTLQFFYLTKSNLFL